jgi:hypothetical protein
METMELRTLVTAVGIFVVVVLLLAAAALGWAWHRLRRIKLPPDPDLFTTLRALPLAFVVGLDLLDLGLDVLATPITWALLDRLKLRALRDVASFEALVPLTGPIPLLTILWLGARVLKLGQAYDPDVIETREAGPGRFVPRV